MIVHLKHGYVAFVDGYLVPLRFSLLYFVGHFTNRWYVDVATHHALSMGQPMMALYAEEKSMTRKLTSIVSC